MKNMLPDGTSIEYTGLFLDKDELQSRLRGINRTELALPYTPPHVTFEYGPDLIQEGIFGEKAEVICIGYGCDGINEGLLVDLRRGSDKLLEAFRRITVPHITLSLSETGRAVDTKNLAFNHINPFTVIGIYGGFHKEDRRVITEL